MFKISSYDIIIIFLYQIASQFFYRHIFRFIQNLKFFHFSQNHIFHFTFYHLQTEYMLLNWWIIVSQPFPLSESSCLYLSASAYKNQGNQLQADSVSASRIYLLYKHLPSALRCCSLPPFPLHTLFNLHNLIFSSSHIKKGIAFRNPFLVCSCPVFCLMYL